MLSLPKKKKKNKSWHKFDILVLLRMATENYLTHYQQLTAVLSPQMQTGVCVCDNMWFPSQPWSKSERRSLLPVTAAKYLGSGMHQGTFTSAAGTCACVCERAGGRGLCKSQTSLEGQRDGRHPQAEVTSLKGTLWRREAVVQEKL